MNWKVSIQTFLSFKIQLYIDIIYSWVCEEETADNFNMSTLSSNSQLEAHLFLRINSYCSAGQGWSYVALGSETSSKKKEQRRKTYQTPQKMVQINFVCTSIKFVFKLYFHLHICLVCFCVCVFGLEI